MRLGILSDLLLVGSPSHRKGESPRRRAATYELHFQKSVIAHLSVNIVRWREQRAHRMPHTACKVVVSPYFELTAVIESLCVDAQQRDLRDGRGRQ